MTWYLFLSHYFSLAAINFVMRETLKIVEVFCIHVVPSCSWCTVTKLAVTVFHCNQWSAFSMLQHPKCGAFFAFSP